MRLFVAVAILALAALPNFARATDSDVVYSPASAWNVEFADEFCALRRAFTSEDSKADLELRQYAPGNNVDIIFLAQGLDRRIGRLELRFFPHDAIIDLGPNFSMSAASGFHGFFSPSRFGQSIKDENGEWVESSPEMVRQWAAAVSHLRVEKGLKQAVDIQTGPLDKAIEVMAICNDGLIESWGLDVAAHKMLSQPARLKTQPKFARKVQENYPAKALMGDEQGPVQIRVMVDSLGKVTDCRAIKAFTSELLNDAACQGFVKYAEFEPALDADGTPINSYYVTRVSYSLNQR